MSLSSRASPEETIASERASERQGCSGAGMPCCKFNVWSQAFISRGAVIVLIWSFLTDSVFFLFDPSTFIRNHTSGHYIQIALLICILFFYPFAGWLGDGYFGRYKVVSIGLLVTWAMVIASGVSVLVDQYALNNKNSWINHALFSVAYVVIHLGYVWLCTNLLPLGIDQLQGATSEHLRTYTYWYTWTLVASQFVAESVVTWLAQVPVVVTVLVPAICFTLAVILNFLLRESLVKEPPTPHLLKNTYGILKFTI